MNRKKLISLCLVLLLLLSVLVGCTNPSEPTENDQAQTVPPRIIAACGTARNPRFVFGHGRA